MAGKIIIELNDEQMVKLVTEGELSYAEAFKLLELTYDQMQKAAMAELDPDNLIGDD